MPNMDARSIAIGIIVVVLLVVVGSFALNRYSVSMDVEREPKLAEKMCIRRANLEFPGKLDVLQIERVGKHAVLVSYYCQTFGNQMYEIEISDVRKSYIPSTCNCEGLR